MQSSLRLREADVLLIHAMISLIAQDLSLAVLEAVTLLSMRSFKIVYVQKISSYLLALRDNSPFIHLH